MNNKNLNKKIALLEQYFKNKSNISMAFLFGSYAKGNETTESDIDIAVYFTPSTRRLEWEEEKIYEDENIIWSDIENIINIKTDLIILNRAPSTLVFSILQDGIPIIIKDQSFYLRFFLMISDAAEEFRAFVWDFWQIKKRSASLSEIDRDRLIILYDFLEDELKDYSQFKQIKQKDYETNKSFRRNIERWVENIVNSSIDIAKILLSSKKRKIPQTYRQILEQLTTIEDFNENIAKKLSQFSKLRNILAHEYLDIRFSQIKLFLKETDYIYGELLSFVESILKNKD